MPKGFCWDQSGSALIPHSSDVKCTLAILNSKITIYLAKIIAPTINYTIGDIANIPFNALIDGATCKKLSAFADEAIRLAKLNCQENETTYDFMMPSSNASSGIDRTDRINTLERFIDHEALHLYGLTDRDLVAIDRELTDKAISIEEDTDTETNGEAEEGPAASVLSSHNWAQNWIFYAVGIVFGRFDTGVPGGLGCGDFSPEIAMSLKSLPATDGILANDLGQPLDLAARVWQAMETMLGATEARTRVSTALGEGEPLELLSTWFDRFTGQAGGSFWKYHFQLYRKRPVYWPLQSSGRHYTVWLFHERCTRDTLFYIRNDIVEPRLRLAERGIADLKMRGDKDRRARKELDPLLEFADDLREFSKRLQDITDRGYTPHIDDGVLLNAAPLHGILPSWPETNKAWQELEAGEYDWAQQAMEYWPERVKEKCKTNRSFAIAHGLEALYQEKPSTPKRGRRKA